jgi:hypothetical protein
MSDDDTAKIAPADLDPKMRKAVSRRGLLTRELKTAGTEAVKNLPGLAGVFGFALRETVGQRDERLVSYLWQLLMGRVPKPEENAASLELLRNAQTPDEKGDALVDIAWALCQTKDFEDLQRPSPALVRGFYRIALDRDPTDDEKKGALEILADAQERGERVAALEGLFTGLIRSAESVLRRPIGKR